MGHRGEDTWNPRAWTGAFATGLVVAWLRLKYLTETVEDDDAESYSWGDTLSVLKQSYASIIESVKWMDNSLKIIVVIEMIAAFFVALSARSGHYSQVT